MDRRKSQNLFQVSNLPLLKQRYKMIPESNGIYFFYNRSGKIIYIGKSINLRKRIKQHLSSPAGSVDSHLMRMQSEIDQIRWRQTKSELHALLLEARLIKKYLPTYNRHLKNSNKNTWIIFSNDQFPYLKIINSIDAHLYQNHTIYGPFPNRNYSEDILEIIFENFKVRSCTDSSPKKRCARGDLFSCTAPCRGGISDNDYNIKIKKTQDFLGGKDRSILECLRERMLVCSTKMDYINAAKIRDQLLFCRLFLTKQSFYKRFSTEIFILKNPSIGTFIFFKGILVHFTSQNKLFRESRKRIKKKIHAYSSGKSIDNLWEIYERANIVRIFCKKTGELSRFHFFSTGVKSITPIAHNIHCRRENRSQES
jgi:excinuclease UvrABC nuclease subunit